MQYTPQQMMGYTTFKSSTRIGNWNEDVALAEEKQSMLKNTGESGDLVIQKMQRKFSSHTAPSTIEVQGPCVGFDKQLMIFNEDTKGFLAIDLDMVLDSSMDKFGVTTVAAPKPLARNVFVLEPVDEKNSKWFQEHEEKDDLHYGQYFRIRTCDAISSKEKYYLRSQQVSPYCAAQVTNDAQEVSICPHADFSTVWRVVYKDDKWRYEWENEKVHSNHPCIIQHVQTGQFLGSNHANKVANDFGAENEVFCKKQWNTHKSETDVNIWYLVVGNGGRNQAKHPQEQ